MEDIYELICLEDLTPDLQLISKICGMDTVKILLRNCQGLNLYIPRLSRLDRFVIKCLKKFPDKSFKELAKDLKVSEQYLRTVYNRNRAFVKK